VVHKYITIYLIILSTTVSAQTFIQAGGIAWMYNGVNDDRIGVGYSFTKKTPILSEHYNILFGGDPDFADVKQPIIGLVFDYSIGRILCGGFNINVFNKLQSPAIDIGIQPSIGIGYPYLISVTFGYNILVVNMLDEEKNIFSLNIHANVPIKYKEVREPGRQRFLFGTYNIFRIP